jgi:hypothetical protein
LKLCSVRQLIPRSSANDQLLEYPRKNIWPHIKPV